MSYHQNCYSIIISAAFLFIVSPTSTTSVSNSHSPVNYTLHFRDGRILAGYHWLAPTLVVIAQNNLLLGFSLAVGFEMLGCCRCDCRFAYLRHLLMVLGYCNLQPGASSNYFYICFSNLLVLMRFCYYGRRTSPDFVAFLLCRHIQAGLLAEVWVLGYHHCLFSIPISTHAQMDQTQSHIP